MKALSSREMIKILEADGWYITGIHGSHHYYKHSTKPGKITVPHPRTSYPPKTQASILKQAGL